MHKFFQFQNQWQDNIGLNRFGFRCSQNNKFHLFGTGLKDSKSHVATCAKDKVFCGIRSRVLSSQGDLQDDFGMVDVAFKCCKINVPGELIW